MHFQGCWAEFGLMTLAELERCGLDRRARQTLVADGALRRVAPRVFAFGEEREGLGLWWQLAATSVLANGPHAALSRAAAAALWGLEGFDLPVPIDVNVPRASSRRGRHVHRIDGGTELVGGLPVTPVRQTLLEVGQDLLPHARFEGDPRPIGPDDRLELAVESALRRRLVDECELLERAAFPPPGRHRAAMLVECLERRPLGAPATESYLETRGVQLLRRVGLPTGRRQVELRDERGGFIGRVDLLLEDWLVVEFDGREHHAREAAFERDRARWDRIVAAGYGLVVFTSDHVERRPRFVADTVADALRGRGPARLGG